MTATEASVRRRTEALRGATGVVPLLAGALLVAGLAVALRRPGDLVLSGGLLGAGMLIGAVLVVRGALLRVRSAAGGLGTRSAMLLAVPVVLVASLIAGVGPAGDLDLPSLGGALLRAAPIGIVLAAAGSGLVLLSDAARRGTEHGPRTARPWAVLAGTTTDDGAPRPPSRRAVAGVGLVLLAAAFGILLASTYLHGQLLLTLLVGTTIALTALAALVAPIAIAVLTALDRSRLKRSRDHERERVAAHLHDSVLQTLALVRRQAHDPAAVDKLVRDQEQQLRAWLADGATFGAATLAGALRDVVSEIYGTAHRSVRLTITGNRPLDPAGDAIAGATREALRNTAQHAPGAAVFVLAQITAGEITTFVRDDGPGFDAASIPVDRRGVRDSIERRVTNVGGTVTIDSSPGAGTEITLHVRTRQTP